MVQNVTDIIRSYDGIARLRGALQGNDCLSSPLLRRLHLLLDQWLIKPDLQDAEIILSNQLLIDSEALRRGYVLVRVFVWALPVLGLIGTVLGISYAVGEFSGFLGQDIGDVNSIRVKLIGVTGGLAFAFLITLEGLLTALLVMLVSSILQNNEESLLSRIQQQVSEIFVPLLQQEANLFRSDRDPADHVRDTASRALEQIRTLAEEVMGHLTKVSTTNVPTVEALVRALEQFGSTATSLSRELDSVSSRITSNSPASGRFRWLLPRSPKPYRQQSKKPR